MKAMQYPTSLAVTFCLVQTGALTLGESSRSQLAAEERLNTGEFATLRSGLLSWGAEELHTESSPPFTAARSDHKLGVLAADRHLHLGAHAATGGGEAEDVARSSDGGSHSGAHATERSAHAGEKVVHATDKVSHAADATDKGTHATDKGLHAAGGATHAADKGSHAAGGSSHAFDKTAHASGGTSHVSGETTHGTDTRAHAADRSSSVANRTLVGASCALEAELSMELRLAVSDAIDSHLDSTDSALNPPCLAETARIVANHISLDSAIKELQRHELAPEAAAIVNFVSKSDQQPDADGDTSQCVCIEVQHHSEGLISADCADHFTEDDQPWCYVPADVFCDPPQIASSQVEGAAWRYCDREQMLSTGRKVLNEMAENSWAEMDTKIIECKAHEKANRDTFAAISLDMARLTEQITDLTRLESEAISKITLKDDDLKAAEAELVKQRRMYEQVTVQDEADLAHRLSDLKVFGFLLAFTKCSEDSAAAFLQVPWQAQDIPVVRVCKYRDGTPALKFANTTMQKTYDDLLTHASRASIGAVLNLVGQEPSHSQSQEHDANVGSTHLADRHPVHGQHEPHCHGEMGDEDKCMKQCSSLPPDCGVLHDKISLMWGDYHDKVDALHFEMVRDEQNWNEVRQNMNDEVNVLMNGKAKFNMRIAEVRSNLVANRQILLEKTRERAKLDEEHEEFQAHCKRTVTFIMYQDMCSTITVRNALLQTSTRCPSETITDCQVDAWVPMPCSVSCDDHCSVSGDLNQCGGSQSIERRIVVEPDECGMRCPSLLRTQPCNQNRCPVDCIMSEWSGWSACTAACEGGVQSHTRSVLTKAAYGGEECNTVEDTRTCNTGSCDRDCVLAEWTDWGRCSAMCGGGIQEKRRHVLIPIRGGGACPKESKATRYQTRSCNENPCVGDEECVGFLDVIIAVDSSGSLMDDGFAAIKHFAALLAAKYVNRYFGLNSNMLGVIQFGNGGVEPDGATVTPAIRSLPLGNCSQCAHDAIQSMEYKRGFTNMAQAFALAGTMFARDGRGGSQSVLLTITDGRPTQIWQTEEMARQLDAKNVQRQFIIINSMAANHNNKQFDLMKKLSSAPWAANMLLISGTGPLKSDEGVFVQKAISQFCPMVMSPGTDAMKAEQLETMLLLKSGYCGHKDEWTLLSSSLGGHTFGDNQQLCKDLTRHAGKTSFVLGKLAKWGQCYATEAVITHDMWDHWLHDRAEPECPDGLKKYHNMYWNFCVVLPEEYGIPDHHA